MKALSLTQPWASLVAVGAKRYETRSWSTGHRGAIAIAASKSFPLDCRALFAGRPFRDVLDEAGLTLDDLVRCCGHVVAVADVVGCIRTDGHAAQLVGLPVPAEHERAFGDYSPGRFAWALDNVRQLDSPVACKGMLGLWEMPSAVYEAVRRNVRGGLQ